MAILSTLAACAGRPFDPKRLEPEWSVSTLRGTAYEHVVVMPRDQPASATLWVFLEGDGLAWVEGGRRIAADPSPRKALAFDLFRLSPMTRAYLGRPCYFGHSRDVGCQPTLWTAARYGEPVVASMVAALERLLRQRSAASVILVGYSGGGVLAYLMAARVPEVSAVVTIAANLDIDAWSGAHGYLPLSDSQNPAQQPELDRHITQIAILGDRDQNVPRGSLAGFFQRQQPDEVWTYHEFDHACCWVRAWPSMLRRIRARLD